MSMRKTIVAAAMAAFAVVGFAGTASASGAGAIGGAIGSPGLLSGNNIQVPVNIPINVCGDNVGILSALLGSAGNVCVNR
ncbi:chaplin [Catenulispora sp. NF23]|uniref:Chaplin n=1 Tax=Catenulispora pinistramenti TaxID=2705254 RepID=A0ABS5KM06_9ACTN|nr:chaplin [Catenulispora pinistramenti]MBS2534288.1 chaplin [Catenulispora pinistramenti]MBS2547087.1 chaplin [Catenulispora pinistramenti]